MAGDRLSESQSAALAGVCRRRGVSLCYVFGSRSAGDADDHSDWDLGMVFGHGHHLGRTSTRWVELVEDMEDIFAGDRVDLIFLQEAPSCLRYEAIRGELLFAADDSARADFEEEVMRRWMDLRPFIEAQERDEAEAIRDGHFVVER